MSAPEKIQAAVWTGLLGLLLLSASGCGDSNDPGGGGDLVSQQIGPEGGTVRSSDGQLTLTFPAGAVIQTQTITIEPLAPSQVASEFADFTVERAYRLGPDGLAFQQPVTVAVPSAASVQHPDGSVEISSGLLLTAEGGNVEALDSVRVEEVDGAWELRGELSHFSPLARTADFVSATLSGVPAEAPVLSRFNAKIVVTAEVLELVSVTHSDRSDNPVVFTGPRDPQRLPLERVQPNHFEGTFPYICDAPGTGKYANFIRMTYSAPTPVPVLLAVSHTRDVRCIEERLTLTVTKTGTGAGTVTSNPAGITCGDGTDACTEAYARGTSVALTAVPDEGSVFVTWLLDCPGGTNVTIVVMDANKLCTAQFDREAAVIEQVGSLQLDHPLEAAALPLTTSGPANATKLLTLGGGSGGAVNVIDFATPAQPTLQPGGVSPFCPNGYDVFFANFLDAPNPVFLVLRETPPSACIGEVPPGQPEIAPLSGRPSEGVAIPSTNIFAIALRLAEGAALQLVDVGEEPRSEGILLAEGGCTGGVAATQDKVFVVVTSRPRGTVDAQCTVNGLSIVDLITKQARFVPVDGQPQDITLTPDGSVGYISDQSAGGSVLTFRPSEGVVTTRPILTNLGADLRMVAPDNRFLAIVTSNTLRVLDPVSGTETANVPSGGVGPVRVLVGADGETLMVPHRNGVVTFFEYKP